VGVTTPSATSATIQATGEIFLYDDGSFDVVELEEYKDEEEDEDEDEDE
jgi:hypothetical protein